MRNKKMMSVFLAAAMLISNGACYVRAEEKPVVKLGANFVMSGGGSAASLDWAKPAVEKAVEEFNAGDHAFSLELVTRDCQNDSSLVGEKNTELLHEGVVAIIGPNSANHGIASLEWASQNEIPVIATTYSPSTEQLGAGGKYGFSVGLCSVNFGRLYALTFMEKDYHSFYMFGTDGSDAIEFFNSFIETLDEKGYSYENLGESWFATTETDFTNIISAAVAADPDCILNLCGGPTGVGALQTGSMYGLLDYPILASVGIGTDLTMTFGSEFPQGMMTVDLAPWYLDTEENAAFSQYSQEYFERTDGIYPAMFTIGWMLAAETMIDAIEIAYNPDTQTASSDDIVKALETSTFETPIGNLTFMPEEAGHLNNLAEVYMVESTYDEEKWPYAYGEIVTSYTSDDLVSQEELTEILANMK